MRENLTYQIIRRLVDFSIPKAHRPTVRKWLISEYDREEKEKVLSQIWSELQIEENTEINLPLQKTWKKIKTSERQTARRVFIKTALQYAAILLLPLISGVIMWQFSKKSPVPPEMIECYVPYGELRSITLPDGSQIEMNAGSLLIYPSEFTANKRQVYLSGEANFSVENNPKQPFIVQTGTLNVEVLGTKFNVEAYLGSGTIITTLEKGAVKIYTRENPKDVIIMKPDEQVSYLMKEKRFITNMVDASDYSAWIMGELRFVNKSLDEILFTLERRYNVRFLVDTKVTITDQYTMKFKAHETIEDALYVLGEIIGTISYKQEGQTIHIYLKSKEVIR